MTRTIDTTVPAFLRRTDKRGVTLSAGPATATASRVETPSKVPAVGPEKPATKAEVKAIRAKAAAETKAVKAAEKQAKLDAAAAVVAAEVVDETDAEATNIPAEPAPKVRRSIVPMKFKARYASHAGTCGDDMALELKAATTKLNEDKRETLDVEALFRIAAANGIDTAKYLNLNNGQKRMNVGNKLRGMLNAGRDVVVDRRTFRAEDHEIA